MWFSDNARLIGCLLVTHLPVKAELERRPDLAGRPLVIVTAGNARQSVVDASPEAVGVSAGQNTAEALSRCSDAVLAPLDAELLRGINEELLKALSDVAPSVESAGTGVFYLDLTGMAGMYGGLAGLAGAMLSAVPSVWRPRLGIGAGKFPAYCAAARASAGGWQEVPADAARWLAPLPVSWLPLRVGDVTHLRRFNVVTLGDIGKLTASALAEFLGPSGLTAWQFAQGCDPAPVVPTLLPERVTEYLEFPYPVDTAAGIEAGISSLAERLWRSAALRGRLVGEAQLSGELESGGQWQFERTLRRPAGASDALVRSLMAGLGARDGAGVGRWPDAPLVDLTLTSAGLVAETGRQGIIWQRERVDGVVDVTGVERLAVMAPASAMPERRWALGLSLAPFNQPHEVAVETTGNVPRRVRAGARRWRPVEQVIDLWEVDTEWWTAAPVHRRYWRLALADGGLLTVYRDLHKNQWYRQGY